MTRSSAEKLLDARGSYLIRESHCCTTPAAGAVADPSVLSPVGSPGESSPNSSRHTKLPASGESADQTADTNSYVLSYKSQSDEFCHFKLVSVANHRKSLQTSLFELSVSIKSHIFRVAKMSLRSY